MISSGLSPVKSSRPKETPVSCHSRLRSARKSGTLLNSVLLQPWPQAAGKTRPVRSRSAEPAPFLQGPRFRIKQFAVSISGKRLRQSTNLPERELKRERCIGQIVLKGCQRLGVGQIQGIISVQGKPHGFQGRDLAQIAAEHMAESHGIKPVAELLKLSF